jgi:Protein of unknown function (DUF2442)
MPDLPEEPMAMEVRIGEHHFTILLEDGRELTVPFEWFVRLRDAPRAQLENVRIMGVGEALSWPDLDEDLHVFDLLYPKRFADEFR